MLYLWLTAPPDPICNDGKRLSEHLYGDGPMFLGGRVWTVKSSQLAVQELGPKAVPLLASWLRERDSLVPEKLRRLLGPTRLRWRISLRTVAQLRIRCS